MEIASAHTSDKYVVVDTNVIVHKTLLLGNPIGASLLYAVRSGGYELALPEVIEAEISKHVVRLGLEASETISSEYARIEVLMGKRDDYEVPQLEDFESRVAARLTELNVNKRIPFTLEHARSAIDRVNESTPPNGPKNQQFKDSAIWEALVSLSQEGEVFFITEDQGFFEGRQPGRGLAGNLKIEAQACANQIHVFYGISEFLDTIVETLPELDLQRIARSINELLYDSLSREAKEKDFTLGDLYDFELSPYLTEVAGQIAIDFELDYEATGEFVDGLGSSTEALRRVKGNCRLDVESNSLSDMQLTEQQLLTLDEQIIPGFGHHYLFASGLVLGRRMVKHNLREPVPVASAQER